MESLIALLIAAATLVAAFLLGISYGKDAAYDEAFDSVLRTVNEVYEEEAWNR